MKVSKRDRHEEMRRLWRVRRGAMLAAVRSAATKHGAWSRERVALADAVKAAGELVTLLNKPNR